MLIVTIAIAAFIVLGFILLGLGVYKITQAEEVGAPLYVIGLTVAALATWAAYRAADAPTCRLAPASLVLPAEAP